jgi:hypothetical protein
VAAVGESRTWGRVGGLTAWSRNDAATMVAPAHRAFRARFERLVDPTGTLEPEERRRRADRALRAHMLTLAAKSAASRSKARPSDKVNRAGQAGDGVE